MSRGAGEVATIHISPEAEGAMRSVRTVRAVPGRGLEGDRYFRAVGTYSDRPGAGREVTLIELEAIEAMARDSEAQIAPGDARRNVVSVRLCEPCSHLESLTRRGVLEGLVHRGGLRAQILTEGDIHVGDPIEPLEGAPMDARPVGVAAEH